MRVPNLYVFTLIACACTASAAPFKSLSNAKLAAAVQPDFEGFFPPTLVDILSALPPLPAARSAA
ncbi:hypothetical protein BC834DRAFT_974008 [Gloeopeniophorella convolvens]|nr:hypothetical protein BC834DRAFT_974008 [Gloeopeniophorella convolvens]